MEMGAEVQFEITDVETMVREVVDHQDILRSLGRTLITKTLTKKTVQALYKDKVGGLLLNLINYAFTAFTEVSGREDQR